MDISDFIISIDTTVLDAMQAINKNARGIAYICKGKVLIAVVTDGDIRRYILKGGKLTEPVLTIANKAPKVLRYGRDVDEDWYMQRNGISSVPLIDDGNQIVSIRFIGTERVHWKSKLLIPVVIMAGGKGTRLYPYTQILPKPLIPFGDKTITELIMDKFESFGCNHFELIINYKKNFIKSYFSDSESKRDITFIEEDEFLGTAGGLKLLSGKIKTSFFMTNCDILIDEDYSRILEFHKKRGSLITMVCAIKKVTIPYGTVELSAQGNACKLDEKPEFNFMANTGLYVIEPEFLDRIPKNQFIHITDVIQGCIERQEKVGVYPISEHAWMDMGQMDELKKMRERLMV